MPREQVPILDAGDIFPALEMDTVSGERLRATADLAGKWAVILFYRGDWCRYCRQQLLDFQVSEELFRKLDIQVVAASVDPLDKAQKTVQELGLTFQVGYGLDAKAVSALTGAFYEDSPRHLHATGFLVSPSGKVFNAVYSSRSIGRLTAQDVATIVEIVRNREKQQ